MGEPVEPVKPWTEHRNNAEDQRSWGLADWQAAVKRADVVLLCDADC